MVDALRLFQLALSTPRPGPLGRLAWQPVTAGRSSRFAGMTPDVPGSGRGQWSTLDPGERTTSQPHGRRESRSPARTAAGIALTLVQYVRSAPIPFGPAVASPFPCVWRRPRLAVAGAGIADKQGASLKPFEYCKGIITCHLSSAWANGFSATLCLPECFSRVLPAWGMPAREKEEAFPNRYEAAVEPTVTLDLRSVSRRV